MSCTPVNTFAIPGPTGPAGAPGTNGTNGVDAFTFLTANFVMPAESATVLVSVADSSWMVLGSVVFTFAGAGIGYFQVDLLPTSTSVSLINLRNTAAGEYLQNSAPGTTFTVGGKIGAGGVQGPLGVPASGAFLVANNLNEGTAATMRTSLGLGTVATFAQGNADTNVPRADGALVAGRAVFATAAGLETKLAAAAVAAIGAQSSDAFLTSIATLGTGADKTLYTTGVDTAAETSLTAYMRTVLAAIDAATARGLLGVTTNASYALYRYQLATGNPGAFLPATAWTVIPFNTEVVDEGGHGVLAGSAVTLDAGTYRYAFRAVVSSAGIFQARLTINGTVAADGYGTSGGDTNVVDNLMSVGEGLFILGVASIIRVEVFGAAAGTFGAAASTGGPEIYSSLSFWRE